MTKKQIMAEYCSVSLEYSSLESAIENLQRLKQDIGDKKSELQYQCDRYSDSDKEYLYLYVEREETDQEYRNRLAHEQMQRDYQEKQERAMYERLSKKYGKEK